MFTSFGSLCQKNRVRHLHNTRTLEKVLNTLVFWRLYYCSTVWSSTSIPGKLISQSCKKSRIILQQELLLQLCNTCFLDNLTPLLLEWGRRSCIKMSKMLSLWGLACVVCKFSCARCNACYAGETSRHFLHTNTQTLSFQHIVLDVYRVQSFVEHPAHWTASRSLTLQLLHGSIELTLRNPCK